MDDMVIVLLMLVSSWASTNLLRVTADLELERQRHELGLRGFALRKIRL